MCRKEDIMNSITFCTRATNFFVFLHIFAVVAELVGAVVTAILVGGAVGFGYFVAIFFGGGLATVASFFLVLSIFYSLGEKIKIRQELQKMNAVNAVTEKSE